MISRASNLDEATCLTAEHCGRRVHEFVEHFRSPSRGRTWASWAPGDSHMYLKGLHADLVALELVVEQRMREIGVEGYQ